jgi:hypothetical protein
MNEKQTTMNIPTIPMPEVVEPTPLPTVERVVVGEGKSFTPLEFPHGDRVREMTLQELMADMQEEE